MKTLILVVIALLLVGFFASSFSLAKTDVEMNEQTSEDSGSDVIASSDIQKEPSVSKESNIAEPVPIYIANESEYGLVAEEIVNQTNHIPVAKRVGFANMRLGTGWIVGEENTGYLINGFWIHQAYAKKEVKSNTEIKSMSYGRLKIAKIGNYRLVKTNDTKIEKGVNFYIIPIKQKSKSLQEAKENSVGVLSLKKEREYSNFIKWTGKLILTSGDKKGNYKVELGTIKKAINPVLIAEGYSKAKKNKEKESEKKAEKPQKESSKRFNLFGKEKANPEKKENLNKTNKAKLSFWRRIFHWRRAKE